MTFCTVLINDGSAVKNGNVGSKSGNGFDLVKRTAIATEMNRICKGIPEFTKEARFPGKCLNFVLNYKNSNKNIAVPNPDCPKNPDFENDKDLKNKPYFTLADLNTCSDGGDRFSGKLDLKYLNEDFKSGAGMLPGKFPVCEADTEKEEFKSCMAKLNEK